MLIKVKVSMRFDERNLSSFFDAFFFPLLLTKYQSLHDEIIRSSEKLPHLWIHFFFSFRFLIFFFFVATSDTHWQRNRNRYWAHRQSRSHQRTCWRKRRHSTATATSHFLRKTNVNFFFFFLLICFFAQSFDSKKFQLAFSFPYLNCFTLLQEWWQNRIRL